MSLERIIGESYKMSASAWLTLACAKLIPDSDAPFVNYLILPITEAGFIFATALGVIETIFWAAIALLAKAIHVFLPQSDTADKIYAQLVTSTILTTMATTSAAILIVKNFFISSSDLESEAFSPVFKTYQTLTENYFSGLIHYRFFGENGVLLPVDSDIDSDIDDD